MTETYQQGGKEHDREGKEHVIARTRCLDCDAVLSEFHHGCCGFVSNGWMSDKKHECPVVHDRGRRLEETT